MTDFTILRHAGSGALRFADTAIDTHIADDAIRTIVNVEKGIANPLGKIPGMGYLPIGQGSFFNRVSQVERQVVATGGPAGSYSDAVESLHNLGTRHGVNGILLGDDPARAGMLRFTGELGFGSTFPPRIDDAARLRIDRAARLVQDFIEAGH